MKKISDFLISSFAFIKRHKYTITIMIFAVNIMFFSEYNVITRLKNNFEINKLKTEIKKYKREYDKNTRILENMKKDPQYIEKIAREKYYMKKENEDIFIISE